VDGRDRSASYKMSPAKRILLVEDDRRTAAIVERYLRDSGFDVTLAGDGRSGIAAYFASNPDLVILDIMLPETDGFEVCRRIRDSGDTPVIMLTARVGESDRLRGLRGGADDYVTKPFSPRELVARVQAVMRRSFNGQEPVPMRVRVGSLELDPIAAEARIDGSELPLTATEYRLLEALATSPGIPWSRSRLLERVFGWDYDGTERTVDTHVANLRRKLVAAGEGVPLIATSFGRGYRLELADDHR
jgi:two-component system, OmpR family, response regulator AdeR